MIARGILGLAMLAFVGCAKSPAPTVSDLVVIAQPLIAGGTAVNLTASSQIYLVNGTCDPNTYVLQWSYDGTSWVEHPGACGTSGTFSIQVKIPVQRDVFVRARGKFSFTPATVAHIHFIAPKTSDFGDSVTASRSDMEVSDAPGLISQYVVGSNFTGEAYVSATHKLRIHLPGVVYEQ